MCCNGRRCKLAARRTALSGGTAPAAGRAVPGGRMNEPGQTRTVVNGLRLQTLVKLRWIAVFGQAAAVLVVHLVLQFPTPIGFCLGVIALSAWLNIFLSLRWRTSLWLSDKAASALLAYDIAQLAALLYLTGGLENPFSFLFLVPVIVSASTLSLRHTFSLVVLVVAAVTLLAYFHLPLPWRPGETLVLPNVYIAGMWAAVICGIGFSVIYAGRVARDARQMSEALAAAELVLAHEQRLTAIDGLAAAAAHELGTPLATIALVAKELARELPNAADFAEDLDLLTSQTERCRNILAQLVNHDSQGDEVFARQKITVLVEELVEPLRYGDADVVVKAAPLREAVATGVIEPVVARSPGVKYGLGNLMDNAADFAQSMVEVAVGWSSDEVAITISDDGPGFAQDVMDRLGEPYVTTRGGYNQSDGDELPVDRHGMGLGFFISKTLLERSGATVVLANKANPEHGAIVRVSWPRRALEPDPGKGRQVT